MTMNRLPPPAPTRSLKCNLPRPNKGQGNSPGSRSREQQLHSGSAGAQVHRQFRRRHSASFGPSDSLSCPSKGQCNSPGSRSREQQLHSGSTGAQVHRKFRRRHSGSFGSSGASSSVPLQLSPTARNAATSPHHASFSHIPQSSSDPAFRAKRTPRRHSMTASVSANSIFQQRASTTSSLSHIQMAQRSNSKEVKRTIASLEKACRIAKERDEGLANETLPLVPPATECSLLSQWAMDAYYRVVITKCNGITTLCNAIQAFRDHVRVQEACCTALGLLLSSRSPSRLEDEKSQAAMDVMAEAMQRYPKSMAIKSALSPLRKAKTAKASSMTARTAAASDRLKKENSRTKRQPLQTLSLPDPLGACQTKSSKTTVNNVDPLLRTSRIEPHKVVEPLEQPPNRVELNGQSLASDRTQDFPGPSKLESFSLHSVASAGSNEAKKRLPSDSLILPLLEQPVQIPS